jgi:hypothetical protein
MGDEVGSLNGIWNQAVLGSFDLEKLGNLGNAQLLHLQSKYFNNIKHISKD